MQSKILGSNFTEDDSVSSEMPTLALYYKLPYKAPGAFLFFMRHMQCLLTLCFISLTVVSAIASENAAALQLMLLAIAVRMLLVTAIPLLSFYSAADLTWAHSNSAAEYRDKFELTA